MSKTLALTLALVTGLVGAGQALAQDFPSKPIQLIVPFKPGGDVDLNARITAKHLVNHLGQPVVVVNTDGGGGNIAAHKLLDSPADGHTLLMFNTVLFTGPVAGSMDVTMDDFDIVGIGTYSDTLIWVTRAEAPYSTVPELNDAVLAAPDTISYAATVGAPSHLQAIAYERAIEGDLKKIDTGSGVDKIVAAISGQVDLLTTNYSLVKDYVTAGQLKILGNLGAERSELIPDVPTFLEGGVDFGANFNMFYVIVAPKGTPDDVKQTLADAIKATVEDPAVAEEFNANYFITGFRDAEEAYDYLKGVEPGFNAMKDIVAADRF